VEGDDEAQPASRTRFLDAPLRQATSLSEASSAPVEASAASETPVDDESADEGKSSGREEERAAPHVNASGQEARCTSAQ
jgi:hypothetical protein